MELEQERFMQGLVPGQQDAVEKRTRKMEQSQVRVSSAWQEMEKVLNQAMPDRNQIARNAQEIDQAMAKWQKEYRKMGSELDIGS